MRVDNVGSQGHLCHIIDDADEIADRWRASFRYDQYPTAGIRSRLMSADTKCDNPMCSCDPCTCAQCACGVVTLGDLERRVLGVVWDLPDPEPTGREVADALPAHAYTT